MRNHNNSKRCWFDTFMYSCLIWFTYVYTRDIFQTNMYFRL